MAATPPTEWIAGTPPTRYLAGYLVALGVPLYAGILLAQRAFPDPRHDPLVSLLGYLALTLLLAVPSGLGFVLLVARPARIGLTPLSLTVDYGARRVSFDWGSVHLRPAEAVCYGRWRWPVRLALTPYQRLRVAEFAASAAG